MEISFKLPIYTKYWFYEKLGKWYYTDDKPKNNPLIKNVLWVSTLNFAFLKDFYGAKRGLD